MTEESSSLAHQRSNEGVHSQRSNCSVKTTLLDSSCPSSGSSNLRSSNNNNDCKYPSSNGCPSGSSHTNTGSLSGSNNYASCLLSSSSSNMSNSASASLPSSYSSFFAVAAAAAHGYSCHNHHPNNSSATTSPSGLHGQSSSSFMSSPLSSSILYPHLYSGVPSSSSTSLASPNHLSTGGANLSGHSSFMANNSSSNCPDATMTASHHFLPSLADASLLGSVWRPY